MIKYKLGLLQWSGVACDFQDTRDHPGLLLHGNSPVCQSPKAWLRVQWMRDANNDSCRKLTGVRLFPSKKITFPSLGFMTFQSWSKQFSAIKGGKTRLVWNIIFIPRSEGWTWPKEKKTESVLKVGGKCAGDTSQCLTCSLAVVRTCCRDRNHRCAVNPPCRRWVPRALEDTSEPAF